MVVPAGVVERGPAQQPHVDEVVAVQRHEDALLVMAGGQAKRITFSSVANVRARDYTVTIEVTGQDPLAITRLAIISTASNATTGSRSGSIQPVAHDV